MKVKFLFSESPLAGNQKSLNLTLDAFFAWTSGTFGTPETVLWSIEGSSELSVRVAPQGMEDSFEYFNFSFLGK